MDSKELITPESVIIDLIKTEDMWPDLPISERRAIVMEFADIVKKYESVAPFDTNAGMVHHMGDGTYGREANVPAGVALVGRTYKEKQINVLIEGKVFVATETKASMMCAPCIFVSDSDTFKVGYVMEDMKWITVMSRKNDEHDPEKILDKHTYEREE